MNRRATLALRQPAALVQKCLDAKGCRVREVGSGNQRARRRPLRPMIWTTAAKPLWTAAAKLPLLVCFHNDRASRTGKTKAGTAAPAVQSSNREPGTSVGGEAGTSPEKSGSFAAAVQSASRQAGKRRIVTRPRPGGQFPLTTLANSNILGG